MSHLFIVCSSSSLRDGEHALGLLKNQLRYTREENISCVGGGIYPNMLCAHPPFQIDANFAGTMAIAQMLVCEEGESIIALPAIPKEWQSGYVKGLRISGNRIVDIEWDGNKKDIKIKDLN